MAAGHGSAATSHSRWRWARCPPAAAAQHSGSQAPRRAGAVACRSGDPAARRACSGTGDPAARRACSGTGDASEKRIWAAPSAPFRLPCPSRLPLLAYVGDFLLACGPNTASRGIGFGGLRSTQCCIVTLLPNVTESESVGRGGDNDAGRGRSTDDTGVSAYSWVYTVLAYFGPQ